MPFSFGASGKPQMSNPSGLTPDGTVVGRVNRRDNNSGMMDALIKLFGEMLGRQKPNNTPENLRALRNDPIGDANKQRDTDVMRADNQAVEGFGSLLGPSTRASGMTPEQVARMQGPTAVNQWKFPELFRQPARPAAPSIAALDNQLAQSLGTTPGVNTEDKMLEGLRTPAPAAPQPQLTTPTPSFGFRLPAPTLSAPSLAPGFSLGPLGKSFPVEPPTFNFDSGPAPSLPSNQPETLQQTAERLRKAEAEQAKKNSQRDPLARGLRALFR